MTRHLSALSLALLMPFATAVAQEARVRDSVGIRIIENPSRKDAPVRFRLGEKPLFEVGGIEVNPDQEFDHKQGFIHGVRLSSGGLAVIDVVRVHYFDAQGKRIRIVGRMGQGPEEFQYLTSICRTRGDTIVVYDNRNRRTTILDDDGRILRTIPQADYGSASNGACLEEGTFVAQSRIGEAASRKNRVTRIRVDGSVLNIVGTFDLPQFDMVTMVGTSMVASANTLLDSNPFTGEIRVYDTLGRLRRIIRTSDRGDRITDAEAEGRMAMTIPTNVSAAERKTRMDQMRARPHATNWPVLYRVLAGADGMTWVQDYERTFALSLVWTAIDSTGRIIGRLEFPPVPERTIRPEVHSFGRDYVMLRRFDADGATYIATYPLIKIDGRSR